MRFLVSLSSSVLLLTGAIVLLAHPAGAGEACSACLSPLVEGDCDDLLTITKERNSHVGGPTGYSVTYTGENWFWYKPLDKPCVEKDPDKPTYCWKRGMRVFDSGGKARERVVLPHLESGDYAFAVRHRAPGTSADRRQLTESVDGGEQRKWLRVTVGSGSLPPVVRVEGSGLKYTGPNRLWVRPTDGSGGTGADWTRTTADLQGGKDYIVDLRFHGDNSIISRLELTVPPGDAGASGLFGVAGPESPFFKW